MTAPKRTKNITKAVSKTINDADPMSSLRAKLKTADPEIQYFVTALEAENMKCVKQLAKIQAENVTLNNQIKVLQKEYPKKQEFVFNVVHDKSPDENK